MPRNIAVSDFPRHSRVFIEKILDCKSFTPGPNPGGASKTYSKQKSPKSFIQDGFGYFLAQFKAPPKHSFCSAEFRIVPCSSVLSVPKLCQEVFPIFPQTVGITGFFANVPFSLCRGTGVAQTDTAPSKSCRYASPGHPLSPLPSQNTATRGKERGKYKKGIEKE